MNDVVTIERPPVAPRAIKRRYLPHYDIERIDRAAVRSRAGQSTWSMPWPETHEELRRGLGQEPRPVCLDGAVDGFLTTHGHFVVGEEAYRIAEACDQLIERTDTKQLTCANLCNVLGRGGEFAPQPQGTNGEVYDLAYSAGILETLNRTLASVETMPREDLVEWLVRERRIVRDRAKAYLGTPAKA